MLTKMNKRPLGFDDPLDNTDRNSKHNVTYDKQMHC